MKRLIEKKIIFELILFSLITASMFYLYQFKTTKYQVIKLGQIKEPPKVVKVNKSECNGLNVTTTNSGSCTIDYARYLPFSNDYKLYKNNSKCALNKEFLRVVTQSEINQYNTELHKVLGVTKSQGYMINFIIDDDVALDWSFEQLLKTCEFLGPQNVFLSILDNSYNATIREKVNNFRNVLHNASLGNYHIILSEVHRPDMHDLDINAFNYNDMLEPFFHFYMNKESKPYGTDHVYMSDLQWKDIEANRTPKFISKVILVKNQFFCVNSILELILQSVLQQADSVSAMNLEDNTMVDHYNYRDVNGQKYIKEKISKDSVTAKRMKLSLPTQVMCSFSGLSVYNAKAFTEDGVRIRRGKDIYKADHPEAGECSNEIPLTICMDFIKFGYIKHVIVPTAQVSRQQLKNTVKRAQDHDQKLNFIPLSDTYLCEPRYEENEVIEVNTHILNVPKL